MPYLPDVLSAAAQYQAALERQDAAALARLARAYHDAYKRIEGKLNALLLETAGRDLTMGEVTRLGQYRSMLSQIGVELRDMEALTRDITRQLADLGIDTGRRNAGNYISILASGETKISADFMRLPSGAIKTMLGFLADDSPLYKGIAGISEHAPDIASALVQGIAQGRSPNEISRLLNRTWGMELTSSMKTARTAMLWAHREASRATYAANGDVVKGWIWYAELDSDTCLSCVSMHGTEHPIDEPLDDHWNGRCVALPLTVFGNPVEKSGETWFREQSEQRQREMMGGRRHAAWQDGKFEFGALSRQVDDTVFGHMRTETPLKDLVRDE